MKIPTKKEKGFTLAETLITLTILGVVAAITVPSLINKYTETANRTKVKKAMAAYEKALNQMVIDNDIKSNIRVALYGNDIADCSNTTRPYFKVVEEDEYSLGCIFKTADGLWWNISDIEKPIISFDQNNLAPSIAKDKKSKKAFYLIGRIDNNGILRINDKSYEDSIQSGNAANQDYMAKLYNFINNIKENKKDCTKEECTNVEKYLAGLYDGHCGNEKKGCTDFYDDEYGFLSDDDPFNDPTIYSINVYDDDGSVAGFTVNNGDYTYCSVDGESAKGICEAAMNNNCITSYEDIYFCCPAGKTPTISGTCT